MMEKNMVRHNDLENADLEIEGPRQEILIPFLGL
jgi:hypothetical protein